MSSSPLKMGVIGAGRIGKIHAQNLASRIPGAQLAGVADVNLAAARELAEQLHVRTATADYCELLKDPSVDAVAICSATNTHAEIVQAAAAAGKHIFCEKPIDLDLARIREALDAVGRAGVKFQVGFNRRFDPSFARVKQLAKEGKVGTLHIVRITSRDPGPPPISYVKVSGGLFLDMAIHDFDMARFLTESEAAEVYAVGAAMVDPDIGLAGDIDTCITTLRMENGALVTIDNSRKAVYGYDQRVEVFGSGGMAAAGNRTADSHVLMTGESVQTAKPQHFFLDRYQESYVIEMQEFVDCVRQDRAPSVGGKDGLAPVVIGLAAKKSLAERRPVKLTEVG